jgi:hypothetical protein
MEEMHKTHKDSAGSWLTALSELTARISGRPKAASSRGLVVTPWNGRSPAGWSA